jgi:hypothetical protein
MSITFACEHCGKTFTLDIKFAGKKGRCKQCGAVMLIPDGGSPALDSVAPVRREVAARRTSTATAPAGRPAPPPANEDIYGFNDEPLPPRAAGGRRSVDDDSGSVVSPVPKKKKKTTGFFAGSGGKSSAGGGGLGFTIVLRVVLALVGLASSSLVLPGIRSALTPGWAFHSDIETFIKRQIDLTNELAAILKNVNDVEAAAAASARANDTIRKLEKNLTDNKDRKGALKDIEAVKNKYANEQQMSVQNFTAEFTRVCSIPGALEALSVMAALTQLDAVERSIPGAGGGNPTFIPPAPPSIPRPHFPPPQNFPPPMNPNPGFNRNPGPNFNRNPSPNRPGQRGPSGPGFPNRRGDN